jgi:hypothetical protein
LEKGISAAHLNKNIEQLCQNDLDCEFPSICVKQLQNPKLGFLNFDNYLSSLLNILQMCSLDNWSFQLFHLQTQVNQYTWVFAFSCVFCGAYVVNVLIMANLTINYYK